MNRPACSVDGCEKPAKTRAMCGMHAERVRQYGTTELPVRPTTCDVEGCERTRSSYGLCAFHRRRVNRGAPLDAPYRWIADTFDDMWTRTATGCWEWQGARNNRGYGTYRQKYAHRVSYERHKGPIPTGLVVDHLCRNRACVNPDHMEAVTNYVNTVVRGTGAGAIGYWTNRCGRGHEWTPENTYVQPSGRRACRACIAIRRTRSGDVAEQQHKVRGRG